MVSDYFQVQFLSASSPLLWLYLCLAVMCMSIVVDQVLYNMRLALHDSVVSMGQMLVQTLDIQV